MTHRNFRLGATTFAALALTGFSAASSSVPLGIDDMIQSSEAIVVGTIEGLNSAWGTDECRWMRTAYDLRLYRVLHGDEGLVPGGTMGFSYWGGRIGNEIHGLGCVTPPKLGGGYVMFMKPDWRTRQFFTPVVGLNQGLLSLEPTMRGTIEVLDADGGRLYIASDGKIVKAWERLRGTSYRGGVTLDELSGYIARNGDSIRSRPRDLWRRSSQRLPAGRPELGIKQGGDSEPMLPMEDRIALDAPERGRGETQRVLGKPLKGGASSSEVAYSTFGHLPSRPTMNQFQSSMDPWSPEDQYQMSKWNYYSDIFRVRSDGGTGTYGWRNGRFDLDGWPSSDDLEAEYGGDFGSDARWGSTEMGVTFYLINGSNEITEADIALNPAFSWTLNDEAVYDGSSSKCYRRTMTHELGHVHGLNHQFNYISVMNYSPDEYRMFGLPNMDDAEGARDNYTAWDVARTDLGVYLYYADGYQSYDDADYDSEVVAGNDMTINRYHVENVGSTNLSSTNIEWYLGTERSYSGTEYYLGEYNYGGLNRFTYFTPSAMTITPEVPQTMPGGRYYLNAYIRDDGGASQSEFPFSNNQAWSRNIVKVFPRLESIVVSDPIVGGESSPTATLNLYSNMGPDSMTASLSDTSSYVGVPSSLTLSSGDGDDDTFTVTTVYAPSPANVTLSATAKGVTVQKVFKLLVATGMVSDDVWGIRGRSVRLRAQLTRRYDGDPVSGQTVRFRVDGVVVGEDVTGSNGYAKFVYAIPMGKPAGNYTVRATLTQNDDYGGSFDTSTLTVRGPIGL